MGGSLIHYTILLIVLSQQITSVAAVAKFIVFSKPLTPTTTTTTEPTTTVSPNKPSVRPNVVNPVRPGRGPDGGNDNVAPTSPLMGRSVTTSLAPEVTPPSTTPSIPMPSRNISEEQIKESYPWIDQPETTLNSSTVPNDGKSRLADTKSIVKLANLNESYYEFVPTLGAQAPTGDGKLYRIRMTQKFKGIPVYQGHLSAEQENTGLIIEESLDGKLVGFIENDVTSTTPSLNENRAIRIAKAFNDDLRRKVEHTSVELTITMQDEKATLSYKVTYFVPEKYVRRWFYFRRGSRGCPNASTEGPGKGVLTRFIYCPPRKPVTIIDAHTGQVYSSWDGLPHAFKVVKMVYGNPKTRYASSFEVVKSGEGNMCSYEYPLAGNKAVRLSNAGDEPGSAYSFPCNSAQRYNFDNKNEELSPRNSAYKWTISTMKFLQKVSNLLTKTDVNIVVHAGSGPRAFWTGKDAGGQLVFPDGDHLFYPMVTPDIVAHEVGHIFTDEHSSLEQRAQSGAISEAFSDMTSVAFLNDQFGNVQFTIGHLAAKSGFPLRDLCEPASSAVLTFDAVKPNRDNAMAWSPTDNIHQAAGIFNRAFCMLCQADGWDIQQAYKVFLDANTYYWGPQTTFNTGACGVRKAAVDLKGSNVIDVIDNIFQSVGIVISC